jgi:hypothetical protein
LNWAVEPKEKILFITSFGISTEDVQAMRTILLRGSTVPYFLNIYSHSN